jgi:ADP-ribose pyrophosphatase
MKETKFINAFETPFFTVEKSVNIFSNNLPYYRIRTNDSIICCLLDEHDNLLLAEQFRPNLGYKTIEFPAGEVENNESPIEAAAREIREEIGVDCSLIPLGSYRLLMNRTNNKEYLYIALMSGKLNGQTEQGITTRVIARKKLINIINDNEFEQLAGIGIIQLINIKFGINFLLDDEIIKKIWT